MRAPAVVWVVDTCSSSVQLRGGRGGCVCVCGWVGGGGGGMSADGHGWVGCPRMTRALPLLQVARQVHSVRPHHAVHPKSTLSAPPSAPENVPEGGGDHHAEHAVHEDLGAVLEGGGVGHAGLHCVCLEVGGRRQEAGSGRQGGGVAGPDESGSWRRQAGGLDNQTLEVAWRTSVVSAQQHGAHELEHRRHQHCLPVLECLGGHRSAERVCLRTGGVPGGGAW